jgi:hypothetical protein
MFRALGLVFGGTVGVGSHFHALRTRTRFRRYRRCWVPFSCFHSRTRFWRCGRRQAPFLCFVLSGSFSAVPRASGPVFMFCAPGLIFSGIEVVGSHIHFLHSRTHFRWYRGCRVPFLYFTRPDSFSTDPRASGPVFMFCALDSFSAVPRASGPVFIFCVSALIFCGTEGVGSRFHVFRSRTHFRLYRGRRVPF